MADFEPKTWADGVEGGTPITADELNRIEQGIVDAQNEDVTVTWADVSGKPAVIGAGSTQAVAREALNLGDLATADSVAYADVTGKPTTFPPATHTHTVANVTGLQDIIDGFEARISALEPDGD